MNSLKCPKSKSLSHCLTELFPIYQNKQWTIRQQDNCSVDPSSHRIILKIVGYQLLWFRRYNLHQNQNFDMKYHKWDTGTNSECTASLTKWSFSGNPDKAVPGLHFEKKLTAFKFWTKKVLVDHMGVLFLHFAFLMKLLMPPFRR